MAHGHSIEIPVTEQDWAAPETPSPGAGSPFCFLRALFEELDRHGIRYCVLHSYEGLPEYLPSDLDLAVHPADAAKLSNVFLTLGELGYRPVQCLDYAVGAGYFVFVWLEGALLHSMAVDVICEHRRGGLILASGESLVAERRRHGGFWVPKPAAEFAYLLSKKALKKSVPAPQKRRLRALVAELGEEKARQIAAGLFGEQWGRKIIQACITEAAGSVVSRLGRTLWWTQVSRHPARAIRYQLEEALRLIRRWRQPAGLLVAVLGPDGVGKSAVVEGLVSQLQPAFRRSRKFHWRPEVLWASRTAAPVTNPHGQLPRGAWRSMARLIGYLLDYCVGYCLVIRPLLARGGLVVFDRYFDDVLADPRRYRYGGPLWWVRALRRLAPRPELALILDAPESVVLSRTRELPVEEVRELRRAYLELGERSLPATFVNTARPRPQMIAEATRVAVNHLASRFRRRSAGYGGLGSRPGRNHSGEDTLRQALYRWLGKDCDKALLAHSNLGGHESPSCFAVLPSLRTPRWLVPLRDTASTLAGLKIYTPYSPAARIARALLVRSIKSGWRGWARYRLILPNGVFQAPLQDLARQITGEDHPVMSFSLGTASRYRKLTVQVASTGGEVLGCMKLPLTTAATARIRHEASALQRLQKVPALRPHIPQLLDAREWQDGYLLFQSACSGLPGPVDFLEIHETFLQILGTVSPTEKSAPLLIEEIAARWQKAAGLLDAEWRRLAEKALEWALRELRGETLTCGVAHGDFAPWNTRVKDGQLRIFDWESVNWEAPPLWDRLHFLVQASGLASWLPGNGNRLVPQDSAEHTALLLLYLVDSASQLIGEGPEGQERDLNHRKRILVRSLKNLSR